MTPLISVLIFAYNHEEYIEQTIDSVINQKTSFVFEIIVSDDCSTDNTLNIINEKVKASVVETKVVSNAKNLGLNETFENAVRMSSGKYIALIGGDDYWLDENKLEIQLSYLKKHGDLVMVHTAYKALSVETGKVWSCNSKWHSCLQKAVPSSKKIYSMLCHEWSGYPLASSCCFLKQLLIDGMDRYPEILSYNCTGEGTILHLSMCLSGGKYGFIAKETTLYRVKKSSLSHSDSSEKKFVFDKNYSSLRNYVATLTNLPDKYKNRVCNITFLDLMYCSLRYRMQKSFLVFINNDLGCCCLSKSNQLLIWLYKNRVGQYIVYGYLCFRKILKKMRMEVIKLNSFV